MCVIIIFRRARAFRIRITFVIEKKNQKNEIKKTNKKQVKRKPENNCPGIGGLGVA